MRWLLLIPVMVVATAACGWGLCRAMNWNPGITAMLVAGIAAAIASLAAGVPLVLTRSATQAGVSQAALVTTLIHMMGCAGTAAVVLMTKQPVGPAFTYWMFAFYVVTLVVLVTACVQAVKSAPVTPPRA